MRVLASVSLRFAVVVLFCAGLCSVAKAQVTIDREYISRLEYVCKVWGYLKYFHTGIDSTKSWDDSLTQTLSRVKVAQTQAAYLEEVDRLIAGAGLSQGQQRPHPSFPSNYVFRWIIRGCITNKCSVLPPLRHFSRFSKISALSKVITSNPH